MAKTQKTSFWRYIILFWCLIGGGILSIVLLFLAISAGLFGDLPDSKHLENPKSSLATEVYTADHQLIGKYYSQNRSNIDYKNLPQNLVNCLIATEDIRYSGHAGVDFRALMRVVKGVITMNSAGGGSTITQQLAKNLFPRERLTKLGLVIRKLKEWVIAVRLERAYSKEEIMTMYLNTVEFSDNAFGVKSAASTYFRKPVDSLKVHESAILVGMLKAPYRYNPRIHPENSTKRRNVVFHQLHRYDFITKEQKDSLQAMPIVINFSRSAHDEGLAPYFRENLRMQLKIWCSKNKKPDGTSYDIYRDGLRIYTTIDSKMQKYAEEAVEEHLSDLQPIFHKHWKGRNPWKDFPNELRRAYNTSDVYKSLQSSGLSKDSIEIVMDSKVETRIFTWQGEKDTVMSPKELIRHNRMFLQTGLMSMDPETGYIKAWVGGINYKHFQYDHVNLNTKRQIGSTFKPFVYAVALESGYSPCLEIPNQPVTFEKSNPRWNLPETWTPKNADNQYGGMMTIKQGLAKSVNTITAYLMHQTGPQPVVDLARRMGITDSKIEPFPSICLGTPDISVFEMVGAYGSFANLGVYTQPLFIARIEDKNGNLIEEFQPMKREEALKEETAYVMTELLANVVDNGTGRRLRFKYNMDQAIAGKTGTTQNHSDGWFMGYTPELVTGVWVGCEDRFVRFRTIKYGQGASLALPIWALYNKKVYADATLGYQSDAKFKKTKRRISIELDCEKYTNQDSGTQDAAGSEFD